MKDISFALIGAGNIAGTHIAALNSLREVRLTGILSLSGCKKSRSLTHQFGIKAYKTFQEVLNDKGVDAVDIITKHDLHAKLGIQAATHGKHVLVEKPIATSLKEADDLIRTCDKNKVKLSVISQNRFAPPYINLKKAINENKFGEINLTVVSCIIHRNKNYFSSSPWRGSKREAGGGFLIMNAIHYIDLLRWLFGPVLSVQGGIKQFRHRDIEVEDTAWAILKFKNGARGIIYGTTAASSNLPPRLEIYGSKGNIRIEDKQYLIGSRELFIKQIKNFVLVIKQNKKPLIDGVEGKKALETVLAIYKSARLQKQIFLSP